MNWDDDNSSKRRIRSSRNKKIGSMQMKQKQRTRDIHDHRSWPPGTFMLFDNRTQAISIRRPDIAHMGLGIVVANDNSGWIWVLWASNCREPLVKYRCDNLTIECVFHVGGAP